jgi:polyferredoxin
MNKTFDSLIRYPLYIFLLLYGIYLGYNSPYPTLFGALWHYALYFSIGYFIFLFFYIIINLFKENK